MEADADGRQFIGTLLSSAGCDVVGSKTADDALTVAGDVRPDLVILDLKLPDVWSRETARRMAHDWRAFGVPILMTSALEDEGRKFVRRFRGPYDYLDKPFPCEQLLSRVRSLLRE